MTQSTAWSELKFPLIIIAIALPFAMMKWIGDAQEKADKAGDSARDKAAEVVVTPPQSQPTREPDAHQSDLSKQQRMWKEWEDEAERAKRAARESKPTMSYEQSVRKAWEDAEKSNREADTAQDALIESYRRRAVSADTSSGIGARIDTFIMPDGKVVYCRTTVRNNARATSCR